MFFAHQQSATRFMLWLWLLALYYMSYRYPFQINSSTTSPTYSDTPAMLKWGKYVFFMMICSSFGIRFFDPLQRLTHIQFALIVGWVGVMLYTFAIIALYGAPVTLLEVSLFSILLITCLLGRFEDINLKRIYRFVLWFILLTYAFNLIQIMLYYGTGRTPALAYAGTVSVRFGGLWDDPNGFGLFQAFTIAFLGLAPIKTWVRYLLIAAGIAFILMSQSVTGLFGTIAGLGILLLIHYRHRPAALIVLLVKIGLAVSTIILIYGPLKLLALFNHWLEIKMDSIGRRGDFISDMFSLDWQTYIGLIPDFRMTENGYTYILTNLGLFPLIVYLLTIGYLIRQLYQLKQLHKHIPEYYAFWMAGLCFVIAFMVANLGVPSMIVYPLNFIIFILLGLAIIAKRQIQRAS